MATSTFEVEVICLTGNDIDEIAPERPEDVATAEHVFLQDSVEISELGQISSMCRRAYRAKTTDGWSP